MQSHIQAHQGPVNTLQWSPVEHLSHLLLSASMDRTFKVSHNFDPYNVLLTIATNIPVLLMTAFVLQEHAHTLSLSITHTHTHIYSVVVPREVGILLIYAALFFQTARQSMNYAITSDV